MKFDYCIGNPPFNADFSTSGDNDTYAPPVYHEFLDSAYTVSDKVEMIHPARFLFNAGSTPKKWNEKRLNDEHFKVLYYEPDSNKVFPDLSTPLKGGVAITYRDEKKDFGAIKNFITSKELNGIKRKVLNFANFRPLSGLYNAPESYRFSQELYYSFPDLKNMTYIDKQGKSKPLISKGHDFDLSTNIFEKLGTIVFTFSKINEDDIAVIGRKGNQRIIMYINKKFVRNFHSLDAFKVLLPKSNGSGQFGEALSSPIVSNPGEGHTQTFISFGGFKSKEEAINLVKYIKTKFLRCLLGISKVTQDNKEKVWVNIPLQDFTPSSDIDWSKSIHEIDLQLYEKYGLSDEEIEFIETHVKEME